jgi:hypothetical protein
LTADPARLGPLVQRALHLAATGQCRTMKALNRALRDEGYLPHALRLHGPEIRRRPIALMDAADAEPPP